MIGIGPGHRDYLLPIAEKHIKNSDILIGGGRNLQSFPDYKGLKVTITKELATIVELMKGERVTKKIALILSGDTGFYSMLNYMKKHFTNEELEVIPGISSFQYLFAKMKEPWQQTTLMSVHGRQDNYIEALQKQGQVALLTDSTYGPEAIAKELLLKGYGGVALIVGENLSYEEERITIGSPEEIILAAPYEMSVVVIKNG